MASDSIEQPEPPASKTPKTSGPPAGTADDAGRVSREADAPRPGNGTSVIAVDSPDSESRTGARTTRKAPERIAPAQSTGPAATGPAPAAAESTSPAKSAAAAAASGVAGTAGTGTGTTAPATAAGTTPGATAAGTTSQATGAPGAAAGPAPTGKDGDPAATKTDLPPVPGAEKPAQEAAALGAAYGLARLTRRRLRPPGTPRHAAVPLNPVLRRYPAVHGMAQRSLDGAAAWRRSRWGRLTLPGLLLLALLVAGGMSGGLLVPAVAGTRTAQGTPAPDPTPGAVDPTAAAPGPELPVPPLVTDLPIGPSAGVTPTAPVAGARPADALATWAQQVGTKAGIPLVAMQAYGYAEWVVGQRQPNCHLTWTTLAAIGKVESNHGRANGATLLPDGESNPPIQGLPLDGNGDRKLIPDTDQGRLDGDTTYDRAVGSMQFIPTTWAIWKVDADNDGVTDPNDIDDAALAAGNYLCANGKDLSTTEDWWNAILTYNNVEPYAQSVYEAANDFGVRSRT